MHLMDYIRLISSFAAALILTDMAIKGFILVTSNNNNYLGLTLLLSITAICCYASVAYDLMRFIFKE